MVCVNEPVAGYSLPLRISAIASRPSVPLSGGTSHAAACADTAAAITNPTHLDLIGSARCDYRRTNGVGLANRAASTRAFATTSVSAVTLRPSVQVTTVWNGTLTPATSR